MLGWVLARPELANLAPVAALLYFKDNGRYPLHLSSHPRLGARAPVCLTYMDKVCVIGRMIYIWWLTLWWVSWRPLYDDECSLALLSSLFLYGTSFMGMVSLSDDHDHSCESVMHSIREFIVVGPMVQWLYSLLETTLLLLLLLTTRHAAVLWDWV